MTLHEAIIARHSIRSYTDKKIEPEKISLLTDYIENINNESGLYIKLFTNEPGAFGSAVKSYGMFKGVENYFALYGDTSDYEKCGYFGEKLVLYAQTLGLNTCWVALTFDKSKVPDIQGKKLLIVIALGYGTTSGKPHKSKPLKKLYKAEGDVPPLCTEGVTAASLAPTAINQQKFLFELTAGNVVRAKSLHGPYSKMDLGIAKFHFEAGAGKENFIWK